MSRPVFIPADELRRHLDDGSAVAVDCRFDLKVPQAGFQAYLDGHIPDARYAHLDRDLAAPIGADTGRHPLPEPEDFTAFVGALGIAPETLVVAYDDAGGAIAARLWWLLGEIGHHRRALLDGGIQAWVGKGYPLAVEMPDIVATDYSPADPLNEPILPLESVQSFIAGGGILLDARAAPRFAGEAEPIDPVAGHVPGAVNLPFPALSDDTGCLLPPEEVRSTFASLGADGAESAAMCGSGVTACFLIAAMEATGLKPARLYPGSWSEWIRDPQRPVASA